MNRRLFGFVGVPALVASVAVVGLGCAKPTVVGKWQGTTPVQGQSLQTTFDLKPDNTMLQTMTTPAGPITVAGTYKAEEDKLTMTATDVKLNGKALPPMLAAMVPKDKLSTNATYKLDGDALTLTQNGQSVTLNRVKEDAAK